MLAEAGLLPPAIDYDNEQVAHAVEVLIQLFVKERMQ